MIDNVHCALDRGITCFDTAPHYGGGDSERMLGRALGPRRKDVVVVTKCGLGPEGHVVGRPKGRDGRRESILPLVDQSLQRIQTDYLDVLLVHEPDANTPFEETMGALDSVVQQGKVRAVGVSNFTLDQLKECEATRRLNVVQYDFNMFDRRVEREVFPHCQQQGIGVMTYGSLGFGMLTGTFNADTKFADNDMRGTGRPAGSNAGLFFDLGPGASATKPAGCRGFETHRKEPGQDNASACIEMGLVPPCRKRSPGRQPKHSRIRRESGSCGLGAIGRRYTADR